MSDSQGSSSNIDRYIAIVTVIVATVAVYFAWRSNSIAGEAVQLATEANVYSKEANQLAEGANEIALGSNEIAVEANQLSEQVLELNRLQVLPAVRVLSSDFERTTGKLETSAQSRFNLVDCEIELRLFNEGGAPGVIHEYRIEVLHEDQVIGTGYYPPRTTRPTSTARGGPPYHPLVRSVGIELMEEGASEPVGVELPMFVAPYSESRIAIAATIDLYMFGPPINTIIDIENPRNLEFYVNAQVQLGPDGPIVETGPSHCITVQPPG